MKQETNYYIVSEETFYDEDKLLYYTYLGINNEEKTLIASIYGKSESESRMVAKSVKKLLVKDLR